MERINYYDIHNDPQKAWNILSNEISALENDISIMKNNSETVGEMPWDIQQRLHSLWFKIGLIL